MLPPHLRRRRLRRSGAPGLREWVRAIPEWLLFTHPQGLRIAILAGGMAVAAYWVLTLFVLTGADVPTASPPSLILNTAVVDELELWIEERENKRVETYAVGRGDLFLLRSAPR